MTERSEWRDLRDRRMAEPGARDGYEAEKRAYELGQAVKARRTALGMTQKELGRRARLTQSAVARLEAGDGVPTLRVLERIAVALGAELDVSLRETTARSGPAASGGNAGKPVHC
jgi:ribosome-binding protein aMBF1 (putative translation factor)